MEITAYITSITDNPTSRANHLSRWRAWHGWAIAHGADPDHPTRTDVKLYAAHLANGYAPRTIAAHAASLRAIWRAAGRADNPWLEMRAPRQQATAPRGLSRNEMHALMRAVERGGRARDAAAIGLMLYAGLRVSEVARLRVGEVHISERAGRVAIRQAKHYSFRVVPLNADVRRWLARWLEGREPDALAIGLSARQLRALVARYAAQAGVQASPHTLRHTCAHRLREAGVPLDQIAAVLGHSRLDTTTIYTLPTHEELQAAVERI
jgi:integrase/recombinase XerC